MSFCCKLRLSRRDESASLEVGQRDVANGDRQKGQSALTMDGRAWRRPEMNT